jgi:hypothetical protein
MPPQAADSAGAAGTGRPAGAKPTSAVLRSLADKAGERIPFGDVTSAAGSRAHGFGLLLFAMPELLPIPFGMIQRDGFIVATGMVLSTCVAGGLYLAAGAPRDLVA